MTKIGFWADPLCEAGTAVAIYDYAYYNEKLLNNKSYIFYLEYSVKNVEKIIEKFKKKFKLFPVNNFNEVDNILLENNITILYIIKPGKELHLQSKVAKNCIHCVFHSHSPHGDVYACIHQNVLGNNNKYPTVPHMINLPNLEENLRTTLNIPESAIVFGSYGSRYSFNISYINEAVYEIAKNYPNIYFLFANYVKFCTNLPNIIYLPMIIELNEKVKFINTCDAMIWGRKAGENCSLAMGEFCSKNKPIICTDIDVKYLGHKYILKDKAIWYKDKADFIKILTSFNKNEVKNKDWNAYKEYTPENIMKIFNEVFILN